MTSPAASGGVRVVEGLLAHHVDTVYCVPGESYLAVLDAAWLVRDRLRVVSCRHESGAVMMALAAAQLTGRPGAAFVTRGPGATNASIGLHIARQASVPLVLGVGQVSSDFMGRDAFQEVDYEAFFGPLVKHVEQVNDVADVADAVARAFAQAVSGRQGPVVLAFPEDVLQATTDNSAAPQPPAPADLLDDEFAALSQRLMDSKQPLIIAGGGDWRDAECAALATFSGSNHIPVMTSFRRLDVFDNHHASFAGYLGYGAHEAAWTLAEQADCVVVLGARLDEPTTRAYQLFADPAARQLIHVYPGAEDLGRNYTPHVSICARAGSVASRLATLKIPEDPGRSSWCKQLHQAWAEAPEPTPEDDGLDPRQVMTCLNRALPDDAIVTIDAGNFSVWPSRMRRYQRPGRFLGPINGAMGFGVPAAIGAALTCPERTVVGCVGDGGFMMTGMELATAARYGARPVILVFNNNRYGTIAMHQRRDYPGHDIATGLTNPDFASLAQSFGLFGARVTSAQDFDSALQVALAAPTASIIELALVHS